MRIKRKMAATNIENHVIAANGLERDGHGSRIDTGNILRDAVLHFGDDSVGHGERIISVGVVILVVLFISLESFSLVANPHPINRESLGNRRVSIDWN